MSLRQFILKLCDFLPQLIDNFDFGIDVHSWFICNERCLHSIIKRTYVFFDIIVWRSQACNHQRVRVSTQTLLEERSEFGVTVRNVTIQCLTLLRPLSETCNNLSQRKKRFVDINSFLRRETSVSCLARSLTAGQIDQLQLASDHIVNGRIVDNFESECKDGVRSRWGMVQIMRSYDLVFDTFIVHFYSMISVIAPENE